MRRLLCLAVAGLFQLPGAASAAAPPSSNPGPETAGVLARHPGSAGPSVTSPLSPKPGGRGPRAVDPLSHGSSGHGPRVTSPLPPVPDRRGPRVVPLPVHPGEPVQAGPGPLRSSPGDRPSRSAKALVLSVAQGEKPLPAAGHALLLCDRPGSTHPDAVGACEALSEVRGDPSRLKPLSGVACTMQYDPVTVSAMGIWNGRFVRFEQTFGSSCSLRAATGTVFSLRNQRGGR
ncbi:SSI family serine proteinase inhibitor [Streptosporangium longisporum]|uniref:Subtilisin inhibitor domain-containing protein n=1 Tax=Streptosporangium longisporum TaxID=46187 RepID=A0ABP6KHL3_9ACTN